MKHYPVKIRVLAFAVLIFECAALTAGFGYLLYAWRKSGVAGASVTYTPKEAVVYRPTGTLSNFYEYDGFKTLVHDRPWLPFPVSVQTNGEGFMGSVEYAIPKPPDVIRIAAIGDSFTEGPYVQTQSSYPSQLETVLNSLAPCRGVRKFEVLNLGVGGYDIPFAAHRFITRGSKYLPDLVLWLVKNDDFEESAELVIGETNRMMSTMSAEAQQDLRQYARYGEIDKTLRDSSEDLWTKLSYLATRDQIQSRSQKLYYDEQTAAVRNVAATTGAQIVFLALSKTHPMYIARLKVWANTIPNLSFAADVPYEVSPDTTFAPHDAHPNERGYARIADAAYEYLMRNSLLCR